MKRQPMTREQSRKRYAKGYGQGDGPGYKPWIEVKSISSRGVSRRVCGRANGRQHALLSDHEWRTFLACQHLKDVVDIREQFPLWELAETEHIAATIGVRHPGPCGAEPQVMTTDLLLTMRCGGLAAIAVKPSAELENKRTLVKLEIERRYWERRHVPWSIVTEKDLPADVAFNLEMLDGSYHVSEATITAEAIVYVEAALLNHLRKWPLAPVTQVCSEIDTELGLRSGIAMTVLKHALARRRWEVDLSQRIDGSKALQGFRWTAVPPAADANQDAQGLYGRGIRTIAKDGASVPIDQSSTSSVTHSADGRRSKCFDANFDSSPVAGRSRRCGRAE